MRKMVVAASVCMLIGFVHGRMQTPPRTPGILDSKAGDRVVLTLDN